MAGFSAVRCGLMFACRCRLYTRDARAGLAISYAAAMAAVATVTFSRRAADFSQVFNIFEPFVYLFTQPVLIMMMVAGTFIALCDLARLPREYMYMLLRCRRSEWWVAEVAFSALVTICFYMAVLVMSVLMAAPGAYATDMWSAFTSSVAYNANDIARIAKAYSSPSIAALYTFAFQTLHALALVQLIMTANMLTLRNTGVALAVLTEVICYCMYLSGVNWFGYVSVFERSMLAWNGMNAARMWQTAAFYVLVLALCMAVQRLALKRHVFIGTRTE